MEIAAQVADALEHAHRAGVVHRDVKPANVLMRPDGTAVLTDFGLARDDDVPSVTLPGGRAGTPYYMSPEQAAGDRGAVDHRTDLFSLGVTLFEMLTARRPFEGDTTESVLHGILTREAPDPRRFNAALPPDLAAVVLRALEKEPSHRYATARDLADDLRAWLAFRPVRARPASSLLRLRRWMRREPLKAALVAVLAAGVPSLAGLFGYLLARVPEIRAGREKLLEDLLEQGLALGGGSDRDHPRAREAFERVLVLAPGHEEGLAGLALVIDRWEGGPAGALAFLAGHAADLARSRGLRRLQAYLLLASGRQEEGVALEAELGPPAGAFDHMTAARCEAVRAQTGDPAALRRCIALCTLATRLSPRPRLSFYLSLPPALVAVDDRPARLETARILEELWPGSSRAWSAIGDLRRGIDPAGAVAAYRRGLDLYPDEKGLLRLLADALRESGQVDAALGVAQHLVVVHPTFDLGHASLGDCLVAGGRVDEGLAVLDRALAMAPDAPWIHARLGAALWRKGLLAQARQRLERALALQPYRPEVARDLACVLLDSGEFAAARRWIGTAIAFVAHDVQAHELMLRCLEQLGDPAALAAERERWTRVQAGN